MESDKKMLTQKDIHNILVKCMTQQQKIEIVKNVGGDVNALKKAEKTVADIANNLTEVFSEGLDYLNKEL